MSYLGERSEIKYGVVQFDPSAPIEDFRDELAKVLSIEAAADFEVALIDELDPTAGFRITLDVTFSHGHPETYQFDSSTVVVVSPISGAINAMSPENAALVFPDLDIILPVPEPEEEPEDPPVEE